MAQTLILILLALAVACARVGTDSAGGPTQEMRDFTMTQTESSRPIWRLKAPRADISMDGNADLEEPVILFFRHGKHASTARARRAVVVGATRDVRLEGDVVLIGHEEEVELRTARLDFSGKTQRFKTEEEVFVKQPGAQLRGRGLEADASLSEITIFEIETRFQ